MTTDAADTPAQAEQHTARWSPAGLSRRSVLTFRRAIMLTLALISYAAILYMVGLLLGDGGTGGAFWSGWTGLDIGIALCIALSAPWTVLGFWNALIGFLLHAMGAGRPAWAAALERDGGPDALDPRDAPPLSSRVALLMTLRNEDPARAMARLLAIRASVDATGEGSAFDLFVLSDSDAPDVVAEEERLFAQLEPRLAGAGAASYRRRERNHGFKAGNIQDFLDAHGDDYAFFAPLDADSAMSGAALLSFARMMEARPRLGLLQSLAVGAPNSSGFGRLFQFGMRHGMRSFTAGSAWWQGDCGPFWGHNALVRTAPFRRACKLPELPGAPPLGGPILSHDQVEAVLMRRAGYEVRVAPIEIDSWEENPPTLLDFIRREERWCTGNMQYWTLLGTPGLRPVSRLQLWQAILMYVASPAWMLMTLLATVKPFEADAAAFNLSLGGGVVRDNVHAEHRAEIGRRGGRARDAGRLSRLWRRLAVRGGVPAGVAVLHADRSCGGVQAHRAADRFGVWTPDQMERTATGRVSTELGRRRGGALGSDPVWTDADRAVAHQRARRAALRRAIVDGPLPVDPHCRRNGGPVIRAMVVAHRAGRDPGRFDAPSLAASGRPP
ncbi:MAG: glucans biosynthesis glucosyltransferase MdoH [Pseudomonadota bacterium]